MRKFERAGIIFWCIAIILIVIAVAAFYRMKNKGPEEILRDMKAGNTFSITELYGHDLDNMVVMNHAAEVVELYDYDLAPVISKYRQMYDSGFELDSSHSIIAFIQYDSYGVDIGDVLACGNIADVIIYDADDEDAVVFTKDIAAADTAEVFLLEQWEARFRMEILDGRRYAVWNN